MLLDEAICLHLRDLKLRGRAERTLEARGRTIRLIAAQLPVPLLRAAPADVATWRAGLMVSDNTVAMYASHLRQFLAWCAAAGLIRKDPMAGLLVPPLRHGLPRPIGEHDLALAVATAAQPARVILVLAAWAGLRAKEIALLTRELILDTAAPPVLVVASWATKGHRERVVALGSFAVDELRAYGLPRNGGYLIPRADGGTGPNRPARISWIANEHLHDCGLAETLHQLRHRYGTLGYGLSRDLRLMQEQLGHSRPETTALYTAWSQAGAAEMAEALPVPAGLRLAA